MDIKVKTIPDADFYDYRLATIFDGYKWDLQAGEQSTISDKVILLGQDDMFFLEKSAVSLYDETVSMERAFWARWNAAHTLSVSTSAIHWGSGANNSTITVTSSANWGVSSNAAWLTISNITGSSFRINATANPNPTQRGATVTVTGGGLSRTVNVTQAAAAASTLTVSQGTWNPTSAASNLTVNVTSNLSWGFSSNVAWLTFSNATPANTTGNGSFRINATANTGAQRTGVVTVTGGGLTRSITVTQAAVNRIITFDLAGGRYNGSPGPINHTIPAGVQIGVSRVPVPVLDGHVFSGWRHADGRLSSREQVGAIIVTHTGTLTAVWTPLIRTITFNLNFGNVNGTPGPINHAIPVGVAIGESRVPIPTRNGFIFTGWLHADGRISTREQVGAIVVTHTGTLTAQWAVPAHPTRPTAPRGPFATQNAAAQAWANHIYSTSLFIRHEHSAVIYRTAAGQYRLTRTASGSPHGADGMNDLLNEVPSGATRVVGLHTHPNLEVLASGDITWARGRGIDIYAATPTTRSGTSAFHLLRYDVRNSVRITVGPVSLRNLTVAERTALEALYRASWRAHFDANGDCRQGFSICRTINWPTSPWPPR